MKKAIFVKPVLIKSDKKTNIWSYKYFNVKLHYDVLNLNTVDETIYYKLLLCSLEKEDNIDVGDLVTDGYNLAIIKSITHEHYTISEVDDDIVLERDISLLKNLYKVVATDENINPEIINRYINQYNYGNMEHFYYWADTDILKDDNLYNGWTNLSEESLNTIHPKFERKVEYNEVDILEIYLKDTNLSIKELVERKALSSIVQAMKAYKNT